MERLNERLEDGFDPVQGAGTALVDTVPDADGDDCRDAESDEAIPIKRLVVEHFTLLWAEYISWFIINKYSITQFMLNVNDLP